MLGTADALGRFAGPEAEETRRFFAALPGSVFRAQLGKAALVNDGAALDYGCDADLALFVHIQLKPR